MKSRVLSKAAKTAPPFEKGGWGGFFQHKYVVAVLRQVQKIPPLTPSIGKLWIALCDRGEGFGDGNQEIRHLEAFPRCPSGWSTSPIKSCCFAGYLCLGYANDP